MSTRFRRTNQMIEIDDKRIMLGLASVDWQRCANVVQLAHDASIEPIYGDATPDATPVPALQSTPVPQGNAGIEYTPFGEEPTPLENGSGLSQADVVQLATKTATAIIGASMSQFEARLNTVANSVRPKQVIAGIKINDRPVTPMPDGAHPDLPELIRKSNALRSICKSLLLVGPAGSGKTLIGRQFASALKLPLTIIPLSQGVSEAHLHGRFTPTGWQAGVFADAFAKPGVIVLDELDGADRNSALSLNAPLSAPGYTNPLNGVWTERHPDCWIIATANTMGKGSDGLYSARERLDAATLDRFLAVPVGYLETVEDALLVCAKLRGDLRTLRTVIEDNGAVEFVGYRAFQTAQVLKDAGYNRDQILTMLIYPYAPDLKDAAVKKLRILWSIDT